MLFSILLKLIFPVYTYSPFSGIDSISFSYCLECISSCKVDFTTVQLKVAAFNGIYAAVSAANHSETKIMTYLYYADATYLHLSMCYLYKSWHLHVNMTHILSSVNAHVYMFLLLHQ
uniref:Uncharacterized protein n=1 Tax=Micrurus corallinus TaxID=54390 RepID=A0A2D4GHR9_MICCO